MRISALGINVQSNGISDATQQLKNLAEASKVAGTEVSKLSKKAEKLNTAMNAAGVDKYSDSISKQSTSVNASIAALNSYESALNRILTAQKQISKSSFEINEALMVQSKSTSDLTKKKEELKNSIDRASSSGHLFNNTLRSMASAAAAYISLNFAKEAIQTADGWVMAQNKLALALGTMKAAKSVQEDLYQSAQALRSPLESMTQLYNRMTVPMMALGKSGKETMQVVEGVAAALKLSGATGAEASSVMLQFSQSMNSGRLNGGEFNAVAEGAPIILRAIEKELKAVGKGAELSSSGLKKMAADGKLTMDIVAPAVAKMGQVWKEQLESMPLTVDSALERIKNAWTRELGKLNENTKFTEGLSKAVSSIEQMLPSLAQAFGSAMSFIANHFEGIKTLLTSLLAMGVASWFGGILASLTPMIAAFSSATGVVAGFGAALGVIGFNPWIAGLRAVVGVGTALYMNLKEQNTELELQNKIRDKLMDQNNGTLKAMDAEIDRIKTQINLQREKIGLSRIYEDQFDRMADKQRAEELDTKKRAVEEAEKSVNLAKKAFEAKSKVFNNRQSGEFSFFEAMKGGGSIVKETNDLKDANEKLKKSKEDLYNIELRTQQVESMRFAKAENQVKVNSADAMNAAIAETRNKHTAKALELENKLAKLRSDYTGERGAGSEFAKQELLLTKLIAEENKKALGHQEKMKANHYERLTEVSKEAKIQEQLNERLALFSRTSIEDEDKLLEATKRRITLETQLDQFKDKTLNKLDLEKKALIEKGIAETKVSEELEAKVRTEENYRKKAKVAMGENLSGLESERKLLAILNQQVEERESREESKAKVTLTALESELQLLVGMSEMYGITNSEAEKYIKTLKDRIDVLKDILKAEDSLQKRKEDDKRQKELDKAVKEYENKWEAANKKIADGLYESLTGGFGSFTKKITKDLKEWAFRLVLNPIIQPIASFGASLLYPNATGAANVMGAGSGGGFGGGLSALGNMITGGFTKSIGSLLGYAGQGISSLGGMLGSTTMQGFGMGMQGAMSLEGSTALSMGLEGASAGAGLSSALSTIAPWAAGAMLLYQGLKGGEKQTTGQWLEANLGTNDLKRVQTWEKQNGFLRGTDSGKYYWDLASSTTNVDGRGYTDTAGMAADKAMLNALTTGYAAIKKANEDYAKALGLNADFIKDRTDRINFQYGKTAEETQSALEKSFKEVNDNIATQLLIPLESLKKAGESSGDTLKRLAEGITGVNSIFKMLGYSALELNTTGVAAANRLTELAGGLSNFASLTSSYYQKYYTEAERVKISTSTLTDSFKALGFELPASKEALRRLIEAQKLLQTEAGDKTFVELLKLADAFDQVSTSASTTTEEFNKSFEKKWNAGILDYVDEVKSQKMAITAARDAEIKAKQEANDKVAEALKANFDMMKSNAMKYGKDIDSFMKEYSKSLFPEYFLNNNTISNAVATLKTAGVFLRELWSNALNSVNFYKSIEAVGKVAMIAGETLSESTVLDFTTNRMGGSAAMKSSIGKSLRDVFASPEVFAATTGGLDALRFKIGYFAADGVGADVSEFERQTKNLTLALRDGIISTNDYKKGMAALNQIAKDFGFDQVIGNIEASKQRLKLAIADYAREGNNLLVDYFSQITKSVDNMATSVENASDSFNIVTESIGRLRSMTYALSSATIASISDGSFNANAKQGLLMSSAANALRKIVNTSEGSKIQSQIASNPLFTGKDSQYLSTLVEGVKVGDSNSLEKVFARLNSALIKGNINQAQYVELLNITANSFKGLAGETTNATKSASELVASFNLLKKSASDLADKLLLSNFSTLNPINRIDEAKRQYDNVVTKALRGEFVDTAKLDEVVNNYLTAGQQGFAEYSDYTNLFSNVIGDLRNLQNMPDKQDAQTQAITQSISELRDILKVIGEKEVLTSIDIKNTLDRIQKDGLPPYVA